MQTVSDIISAAGGDEKVQKHCRISDEALKKWRQKGFVPPKHWPRMVKLLAGTYGYDDLAEMLK